MRAPSTMTMKPAIALAALLCASSAGCPAKHVAPPPTVGVYSWVTEAFWGFAAPLLTDNCQNWQCGANTANVDLLRVNPLDLNGEAENLFDVQNSKCKVDHVYVDATLSTSLGRFERLVAGKWAECQEGKFTLHSSHPKKTVVILFAYEGTVQRYQGPTLPMYQFTTEVGAALCGPEWWDSAAPTSPKTTSAVLIGGETYIPSKAEVKWTDTDRTEHFNVVNIACAGTALAKMALLGYSPDGTLEKRDERQTILKLVTARYCKTKPEDAYTNAGVPLAWRQYAAGAVLNNVEAFWKHDGAACLSHGRVFVQGSGWPASLETAWVNGIRQDCGIAKACEAYGPAEGRYDSQWITRVEDHIAHSPSPSPSTTTSTSLSSSPSP